MTCNDRWEFTRSKGLYTHKNVLQEEIKNVQFDILINSDISFFIFCANIYLCTENEHNIKMNWNAHFRSQELTGHVF